MNTVRILVIDDNDVLRNLVRRLLVTEGYNVDEAPTGVEGLASYRLEHHDLVITDIVMPDMDGLETIRELRKTDPQVRIIAMSGGGQGREHEYLTLAATFGARKILHKPFDRDELLGAVTGALR